MHSTDTPNKFILNGDLFLGVLSNLEEFFDNLSSNMDSIDEEKAVNNEIEGTCSYKKNTHLKCRLARRKLALIKTRGLFRANVASS